MKIAIMQPYFFPYIGYFQLINLVDKYVIYDDVNFIKGGWINRNRILLNGNPFMINVPMDGASSFRKINEIRVGKNKEKILATIFQAYRKAPFFKGVFPLLSEIIQFDDENLASFITNSILKLSDYLDIKAEFIISSKILKNNDLKGQDKVIEICKKLGADVYYNAIGGLELYKTEDFAKEKIDLKFVKTNDIIYNQGINDFFPNLSIIDLLMFNSLDEIHEILCNFKIIK